MWLGRLYRPGTKFYIPFDFFKVNTLKKMQIPEILAYMDKTMMIKSDSNELKIIALSLYDPCSYTCEWAQSKCPKVCWEKAAVMTETLVIYLQFTKVPLWHLLDRKCTICIIGFDKCSLVLSQFTCDSLNMLQMSWLEHTPGHRS